MDSRRRLRAEELVRRPEFEHLIRKTIQTMCAALPKRLNVPRVRSDKQLAKRRTQRLQRQSYVRASPRAKSESRHKQNVGDFAALAQKRYNPTFTV
jgi:hypothetical protein